MVVTGVLRLSPPLSPPQPQPPQRKPCCRRRTRRAATKAPLDEYARQIGSRLPPGHPAAAFLLPSRRSLFACVALTATNILAVLCAAWLLVVPLLTHVAGPALTVAWRAAPHASDASHARDAAAGGGARAPASVADAGRLPEVPHVPGASANAVLYAAVAEDVTAWLPDAAHDAVAYVPDASEDVASAVTAGTSVPRASTDDDAVAYVPDASEDGTVAGASVPAVDDAVAHVHAAPLDDPPPDSAVSAVSTVYAAVRKLLTAALALPSVALSAVGAASAVVLAASDALAYVADTTPARSFTFLGAGMTAAAFTVSQSDAQQICKVRTARTSSHACAAWCGPRLAPSSPRCRARW